MTVWCLLGASSLCERRWRESLLDKTLRSAIYYTIDWILYDSSVIKCCRVCDWMSEILCISWSEEKICLAAWSIRGNRGGFLSKMDLAIMGGMKELFSPCLMLYGRGMPWTFWCFMKNKRRYYLLRQIEHKTLISQLSWMEGSENKVLNKGLRLNRGKMQTGLCFSLWFTGNKNNCIQNGFSFNNRKLIDVHTEEMGVMASGWASVHFWRGQLFSQNLVTLHIHNICLDETFLTY